MRHDCYRSSWKYCAALSVLLLLCPVWARAAAPAPEGYRLQPGDEIAITVLPRREFDSTGLILPDGKLYLKRAGPVQAAGLTLAELEESVRKALLKILKDPRVTATVLKLAKPPSIPKVTVSGAIVEPGPLDLETGMRLLKAVELAGGPTKEADLSRILVVHKDLSRSMVDLSRTENLTNPKHNITLQDGDSIEVPLMKKLRVTVTGAVLKPGPLIDIDEGARVSKAVELAGGPIKEADLRRVTITHADLTRTLVDLSAETGILNPRHNVPLRDGDSVEVPLRYLSGVVTIGGEVINPGSYELRPGMTLDELIVVAGKLTLVGDPERVQLRRAKDAKMTVNLIEQQKKGASGQIPLEPGDEVYVPKQMDTVVLVGAIPNPGPRSLRPGQTVREFFTQGAVETLVALDDAKVDLKSVQLIRPNQEGVKINLREVLTEREHKHNFTLQSGDVLFLPARDPQQRRQTVWDYLRVLPFVGGLANLFGG